MKILFKKLLNSTIHENFHPQKFQAIQYLCIRNTVLHT